MAQRLQEDFARIGFELQSAPLPDSHEIDDRGESLACSTGPVLSCSRRGEQTHQILLMIHYDTVYSKESHFQKCSFIDSERLRGPGVVDAKGGLMVMRAALEAIEKYRLADNVGLHVLLNPDEEIGSLSSRQVIQSHASQCNIGLVFEPSLASGALAADRKGSGNFAILVRGKSAHAGRNPETGRNAIVHLARIVQEIDQWTNPQLGLSVNVGRVSGGEALNQVPDLAIARVNVRATTQQQASEFVSGLDELSNRFSKDGYRCSWNGQFQNPPKQLDDRGRRLQQELELAAVEIEQTIRWENTGGACDGNKLAAAGLANIDTLGVRGGNLHSDQEWMAVDSIVEKAKLVTSLVSRYANHPW